MNLRFAWRLLQESGSGFADHCALRLCAALSYYSVFSLAPLLILATGLGSIIFGEEAVRGEVAEQLRHYMGAKAAQGVESLLQSTALRGDGWSAALVGGVALFIGASGIFGQLKDALNTIWEVKTKSGGGLMRFFRDRLLSFGMVLVVGFLLLLSLLVTTLLAALSSYAKVYIPVPAVVWATTNLGVSIAVSTALFAAIFKLLPDVRVPWRTVFFGSVATAVLFEIGKFALAFYLGRQSTASPFGAAGSVILVLVWVYYAAAILLFGAELTRIYARLTGVRVPSDPFAQPISAAAREREGMAQIGPQPSGS